MRFGEGCCAHFILVGICSCFSSFPSPSSCCPLSPLSGSWPDVINSPTTGPPDCLQLAYTCIENLVCSPSHLQFVSYSESTVCATAALVRCFTALRFWTDTPSLIFKSFELINRLGSSFF